MASERQISVGGVLVGGGAPVAVQTMTKTETANVGETLAQVERCAEAGADLVRVAVPREEDVVALQTIVERSPVPIIAEFPGRTMAELEPGEKDAISHRGLAARDLRDWLEGR